MEHYTVALARVAKQDLQDIYTHILYTLESPQAAENTLEALHKNMASLSHMPTRHPLLQSPSLNALGYRMIPVNNYLIFYSVQEKTVYVERVLYNKRDWHGLLPQ